MRFFHPPTFTKSNKSATYAKKLLVLRKFVVG